MIYLTVLAVLPNGLKLVQATFAGGVIATSVFNGVVSEARKLKALIHISNDSGYKCDVGDCTVPRSTAYPNQITVKPRYYDYSTSTDGVAIVVPNGVDLSGVTFSVIVLAE